MSSPPCSPVRSATASCGMATGEAIAHLNYLAGQGRVRRERDADGVDWWTPHRNGDRRMTDPIQTELADGVLTVTLARPEKKNAITQAMYAALAEATNRARTDDAVRVLMFKAEGDSFSAGNDIADFIAIGSAGRRRPVRRRAGVPVPQGAGRAGQAGGRGRAGPGGRHRPDAAAPLRHGGGGRGRPAVGALHQPGPGPRGGVVAAAAAGASAISAPSRSSPWASRSTARPPWPGAWPAAPSPPTEVDATADGLAAKLAARAPELAPQDQAADARRRALCGP